MIHPLLEKLRVLSLKGMASALEEQLQDSLSVELSFENRLNLLLDRESIVRDNRRLKDKLYKATLKYKNACMEDIDYHPSRGLDKSTITALANNGWIKKHRNILITGLTGTGKSYLACAFAHKVCLEGGSAKYFRVSKLFEDLLLARASGRYKSVLASLNKIDLLILDDFCLAPMSTEQRRDLLEVIDDRYDTNSTLIISQLPVNHWHEAIADPTVADAILDRVIHNAYKFDLTGESIRKKMALNQMQKEDLLTES